MKPNSAGILERAIRYFDRGSFRKARVCYELAGRVCKSKDARIECRCNLARVLAILGDYKSAKTLYDDLLGEVVGEKKVEIRVAIARTFEEVGRLTEAKREYQTIIDNHPEAANVGDVHYWLGELRIKSRDKDEFALGCKSLDQAMIDRRQIVMDWEIHNARGYAYNLAGLPGNALHELEIALGGSADYIDIPGNIYNNQGTAYALAGDLKKAQQSFEKALNDLYSQNDTKGYAHCCIGMLLARSNQNQSKRHLEDALRLFKQAQDEHEIPRDYAQYYLKAVKARLRTLCKTSTPTQPRVFTQLPDFSRRPVRIGSHPRYDVFVCHASEDKIRYVRPLVAELRKREVKVWVDYRELILGETFVERLDEGLCGARFGVVLLSKAFKVKVWPKRELARLKTLENDGRRRILPVLIGLKYQDLDGDLKKVADRVATTWKNAAGVAEEILRAVQKVV